MKILYPLKTKYNRCWRCYTGGKLIDVMRNEENPTDGFFPEDWLASTVVAVNPERDGKPEFEGLSTAVLSDGSERYLKDLIEENPQGYLGKEHVEKFGKNLGVLAKFLDSAEKLPVQCHPDKIAAKEFFKSDYGKTEAWYILDGRVINGEEPYILMGFKKGVTKEKWRELFEKQDIKGMDECMHKIRVKPGEVYIIEGGCPHAIGSGCLLLEIQEPTDYTISMEKFNSAGEPNPENLIHQGIGYDKMFDCFHYDNFTLDEVIAKYKLEPETDEQNENYKITTHIPYSRTPYFSLKRFDVFKSYTREKAERPSSFSVIDGKGKIKWANGEIDIIKGDCIFIPKETVSFTVEGKVSFIECLPPEI